MTKAPRLRDLQFARIVAWLQARGLEAHTNRDGHTVICKRTPKRSRLTGEER